MYLKFREGFPTCHAVFAFIVSASSFRVSLAISIDSIKHNTNIDVGSKDDANKATTDTNHPRGIGEIINPESNKKEEKRSTTPC